MQLSCLLLETVPSEQARLTIKGRGLICVDAQAVEHLLQRLTVSAASHINCWRSSSCLSVTEDRRLAA